MEQRLSQGKLLQLINRCLRADPNDLDRILTLPGLVDLRTHQSPAGAGLIYLASDRGATTGCLVRDPGAPAAVLELLLQDLGQLLSLTTPTHAVTILLDGYDLEAAERLAALDYRQQDCDYLMSFAGQPVMTDLTVRPYQPDELAAYIELFDSAFIPVRQALGGTPLALWSSRPDWAKEWFASAATRGEMASVWVDGRMAACYRLDGDTIDSLAVAPTMQGRGLGRAIINHCIAEIQRKGSQRVYLYVADRNIRARRLYEQIGFRTEMISRAMTKD